MHVSTFLMFEGQAADALEFYAGLFDDCEIGSVKTHGDGDGPMEGKILTAELTLAGQRFILSDSAISHDFGFTPAISIFIECANAEELDARFAALSEGGEVLMPVDDYGFSRRFGWCADRFGMSWRLNLP